MYSLPILSLREGDFVGSQRCPSSAHTGLLLLPHSAPFITCFIAGLVPAVPTWDTNLSWRCLEMHFSLLFLLCQAIKYQQQ